LVEILRRFVHVFTMFLIGDAAIATDAVAAWSVCLFVRCSLLPYLYFRVSVITKTTKVRTVQISSERKCHDV